MNESESNVNEPSTTSLGRTKRGFRIYVLASALAPLAVGGFLIFVVMPASSGRSAAAEYALMQQGSVKAIWSYAMGWLGLALLVAMYSLWRLGAKAGWQGDQPYSTGRCLRLCLYCFGLISMFSFMPWVVMSLGLVHIREPEASETVWQPAILTPFGLLSLLAALILSGRNYRSEERHLVRERATFARGDS